jgi:mono/diheme cytochrome c family protein
MLAPRASHPFQMGGAPRETTSVPQDRALTPPFDLKDEAVVNEGAILFATTCSYCHKDHEGGGDAGVPTLRDRPYDREYLFKTISNGPLSRRMPAWKVQYSPEQIWKLVAYILSIRRVEG